MYEDHVRAEASVMAVQSFILILDELPVMVEQSRIRRGVNKTQLAKLLGMPRNTLWRFAKGRTVDTDTLRKILRWLSEEV